MVSGVKGPLGVLTGSYGDDDPPPLCMFRNHVPAPFVCIVCRPTCDCISKHYWTSEGLDSGTRVTMLQ